MKTIRFIITTTFLLFFIGCAGDGDVFYNRNPGSNPGGNNATPPNPGGSNTPSNPGNGNNNNPQNPGGNNPVSNINITVSTEFPDGNTTNNAIDVVYEATPGDGTTVTEVSYSINGGAEEYIYLSGDDGISPKGTLGSARVMLVPGENSIAFSAKDSAGGIAGFTVRNRPHYDFGSLPEYDDDYIDDLSDGSGTYVTNRVVAFAKTGVTASQVETAIAAINGTIIGQINAVGMYAIQVPSAQTESGLRNLCESLMSAHPNLFENVLIDIIEDIDIETIYYTNERNQFWNNDDYHWGLTAINAPEVWSTYGSMLHDIKIGVVDNGFRTTHEDLQIPENNVSNLNIADKDHGTHVMCTIGAIHNNGKGLAGVMNINRNSLYGFDAFGKKDPFKSAKAPYYFVIAGLTWNVTKGAKVINFSLASSSDPDPDMRVAYTNAMRSLLAFGYDFVVIKGAGNEGEDAARGGNFSFIPMGDPLRKRIITVGAVNKNVRMVNFSNWGTMVDVVAPGVGIYSCGASNNSQYTSKDGTSMATPHVTGVAGLVWAINPGLSGEQVKQIIVDSAKTEVTNSRGTYYMVDAKAAVDMAVDWNLHALIPSGVKAVASSTNSQITISWNAASGDVASYNIYRDGTLLSSTSATTPLPFFLFNDTRAQPNTRHCYQVSATDAATGKESHKSTQVCATTIPYQPPYGWTAEIVSSTQINLNWNAPDGGAAGYNIYRNGELLTSVTARSFINTGLQPNTQYCYQISAFNAEGNESGKSMRCATTTPGVPPGLTATTTSSTQINLNWNTPSGGAAGYNIYRNGTWLTWITLGTTLSFNSTGLQPNTQYCYQISALNADAKDSEKSAQVCATTQTTQTTIPSGLTAATASSTQINVNWNALSGGAAGYKIYRDGTLLTSGTTISLNDTGLQPNTQYCYQVSAFNAADNESEKSAQVCATTLSLPDVPPNVAAEAVTSIMIHVNWNAASGDVTGYNVHRDGALLKSVTALSLSDTGLQPDTQYCYQVSAFNTSGYESEKSAQICATTPQVLDTVPPTVPENLTAEAVSYTEINLTWTESTDNVGVAGYFIYRDDMASPVDVTSNSYSDAGLADSTQYCYQVSAFDASGNESEKSAQVCATTWSVVYKTISAGQNHTIALKTDGSLWAWGDNNYGQLGDGTNTSSSTPIQIGVETGWLAISAGVDYTIGLKTDGSLWAWGQNGYGRLGDGTNTSRNTPVQIGIETDWAEISADLVHTIALKTDGSLWAWGNNSSGQLGDGTNTNRNTPVQIGVETDWLTISVCFDHTIGLKTDGSLWAWGNNGYGQLGDGTNTSRNTPVQIGIETDWSAISAGTYYTMALKADGSLWAWGQNGSGELGDGTNTDRNTPVQIGIETDWSAISTGWFHTIALKTDGSLWAWGDNGSGQLGDGTNTNRNTPVQIGVETDWSAISGNFSTIALKTNGSLWAWGENGSGQLGDGTNTNRRSPVQITGGQ